MAKGLKKLVGVTLAVVLAAALAIYVLRPTAQPSTSSVVNPPGTDTGTDPPACTDNGQGKANGHDKDAESAKDKDRGKGHGQEKDNGSAKDRGHGHDSDRDGDKKHEKHVDERCGEPTKKPDRPDKPEKRKDGAGSEGRRNDK